MNEKTRYAVLFGALTFSTGLIFSHFAMYIAYGPIVTKWLWSISLSLSIGLICGVIGGYTNFRNPLDERGMRIVQQASRNSWVFLILALSFFTVFLSNNSNQALTPVVLAETWIIAIFIFGITIISHYWR